jgi:hypothetical protein
MNKVLVVDVAFCNVDDYVLAMNEYHQLVQISCAWPMLLQQQFLGNKEVLNDRERLRRKDHHSGSIPEEPDVVLLINDLGILREGSGKALQVLPVRFCNGVHVACLEALDDLIFGDINDGAIDGVLFDLHCVYYNGTLDLCKIIQRNAQRCLKRTCRLLRQNVDARRVGISILLEFNLNDILVVRPMLAPIDFDMIEDGASDRILCDFFVLFDCPTDLYVRL